MRPQESRQPPAGRNVGEDQGANPIAVGAGDDDVTDDFAKMVDEARTECADGDPCSGGA